MKKYFSTCLLILLFGFNLSNAQTSAGNALKLDGTDDYASPLTPNVSEASEGTIEFWFSPQPWIWSTAMWNAGIGHPGANGDWAKIGSHPSTAGNNNLLFGAYAGAWQWNNSGVLPDSGVWRHVAATWSSSGTHIYLDGELISSGGYSGGIPSHSIELIGTSSWSEFFKGFIDEVRFWNFERDSVQIYSTMLDTLSSDYYSNSDSGLIAYYRMEMLEDLGINGDGADDLRDLSVNGNHLDTYGDPTVDQSGAFIITNVEQTSNEIPEQFYLSQNYPNPFNPSTKITFSIPLTPSGAEESITTLKIYDILGNEVTTLINEELSSGEYEVDFNASDLTTGVYFYKLQSGLIVETKKMMLIK
jgi:hypothetical protein